MQKTIQIKPLYTPSGKPTCRTANETCRFYQLTTWGSSEACFWTKRQIIPESYARPTAGCPLHEPNGATDEP